MRSHPQQARLAVLEAGKAGYRRAVAEFRKGSKAWTPAVLAIVNEDMERSNDDKTSAVHFARFEFTPEMIEAMKSGAKITAGVRHDGAPAWSTESYQRHQLEATRPGEGLVHGARVRVISTRLSERPKPRPPPPTPPPPPR